MSIKKIPVRSSFNKSSTIASKSQALVSHNVILLLPSSILWKRTNIFGTSLDFLKESFKNISFLNLHNTREGEALTSLTGEIDQKLFFLLFCLNKELIFMVPGLSDLNCSNSVRVKLPFLGREDHSKKRERKMARGKTKEYTM